MASDQRRTNRMLLILQFVQVELLAVTNLLARRTRVDQVHLARNLFEDNPPLREALTQMPAQFSTPTD